MSYEDLPDFARHFQSDVASSAEAMGMLKEHAFIERVSEPLIEYGEVSAVEPCHFQSRGVKVDAYDIDDDHANLTLIVSQFISHSNLAELNVTNSTIDTIFKRCRSFLEKCISTNYYSQIDISSPAYDLAVLISECRESLLSVKIVLATDGIAKARQAESDTFEGIEIKYVIWDLGRLHSFEKTGQREIILIDFEAEYGRSIKCVRSSDSTETYTTYLAFISGNLLAGLYGRWRTRLLERNVRVFLSNRPKVNRDMRDTIRKEPNMFCAYNNGITVHARAVTTIGDGDGPIEISKVEDFQIVNGGQTTASLYHALKEDKADLSQISVQMKLMVINDNKRQPFLAEDQILSEVLVPKISRYSNSQNRVQFADLLANDPPHPEIERLSRNVLAPDPTGGSLETFWIYERTRGSYNETRRLEARTPAQKRKFDQKYPRPQKFDKSKFGKAWNSYRLQPHTVCMGAMKNFGLFNSWLQEQTTDDWLAFFRKTVAQILMWNATEKMVRKKRYGGYTHAIVSYSLSWFHFSTKLELDLERLWVEQKIHADIMIALDVIADTVNLHIRNTKLNVTEWCKKEECWTSLKESQLPEIPDLKLHFLSNPSKSGIKIESVSETGIVDFCKAKSPDSWKELSKWLKDRGFMAGKQRSQCFNMGKTLQAGRKDPSLVLSRACKKIWEDAENGLNWQPSSSGTD